MKLTIPSKPVFFLILILIAFLIGKSLAKTDKSNRATPQNNKLVQIAPNYFEYSAKAEQVAHQKGRTLLFFWAPWCGTCTVLDEELQADSARLPEGVTVLRVNFDTNKEMKVKYQVAFQHTLVEIDKDGKELNKWVGGNIDLIRQEML